MSSGSVTYVTGTLLRMRNTILLDCLHEHLVSLRTQHRQLVSSHLSMYGVASLKNFLVPAR